MLWEKRTATITHSDGHKVFELKNVEAPKAWSSLATDIAASKYFRKGHETSVKQLITRVAKTITKNSKKYFASKLDVGIFEAELTHLLLHQKLAFNSPVWFNCGIYQTYGIKGSGGAYRVDEKTSKVVETSSAYEFPQCSACFIQDVEDDLGSIFDLLKNEARIFKYGSGTGTNFSKLRGPTEKLSNGGTSSGVMSFLRIFDVAAGAVKSGGTTRRAAKMVILNDDHPELEEFISWKVMEEKKLRLLAGANLVDESGIFGSGQNSNNSIRISEKFMRAVENDGDWKLKLRSNGSTFKTIKARTLWNDIAKAAWECADPGLQFDSNINEWHTCPASGRINASNPCSEYMFLDDSACNLASLNLLKFLNDDGSFDTESFCHAVSISIIAQEILVEFSSYPTAKIARNSHDFRPLGLGYANLGALLMVKGLPYDSPAGRAWAATITALMSGQAYFISSELAESRGAFVGFKKNKKPMLKVIEKHFKAISKTDCSELNLEERPTKILMAAQTVWKKALHQGKKFGFRNAQVTVLAPTGTIALLMDCDTTGVEPDYSLVKTKNLAGGGQLKIVNLCLPRALKHLGYNETQIKAVIDYVLSEANTLEGAPYLSEKHLAIFDCANPSGTGKRFIAPRGHLLMMAAVQPFLSGAISKTVNLPVETTAQEISEIYKDAWELGLKSIAVYRNQSKHAQPLMSFTSPTKAPAAPMAFAEGCIECAHELVQEGACYRCPNCGTTTGCG